MGPNSDSQAQAADTTNPATAAGNNNADNALQTAADTASTSIPNPPAGSNVDVSGVDDAAYADFKAKLDRGEITLEAQVPAVESAAATPGTENQQQEEGTQGGKPPEDGTAGTKADDDKDDHAPNRIRLTDLDEHERFAVKLFRDAKASGKPLSMAEAEKRARIAYGIEEPAAANETAQTDTQQAPSTVADLDTKLKDLRTQYREAARQVDTEKMAELMEQIDDTRDQISVARQNETVSMDLEATQLQETKKDLREKFPDFANKGSALSIEWTRIHAEMEARKDPILNGSPASVTRYITLLAADNLGVAPVAKKAASSTPATTQKTLPPVLPGSGAQRTVTPTDTSGQVEQQIASARTQEEYEALKTKLFPDVAAA